MQRDELERLIHESIERRNGGWIGKAVQWMSLCIGFVTLSVFLWQGGAWRATSERAVLDVAALRGEFSALQRDSTGGAKSYMAANDQRLKSAEERLVRVENALISLSKIQEDIAAMKVQMNTLVEQHHNTKGNP